jgi:protein involved in polysaccharide export with SLBB domain
VILVCRTIAWLILALTLVACGGNPAWSLRVHNESVTEARVIRVQADGKTAAYRVGPQDVTFVVVQAQPYQGSVEILDGDSCEVIGRIDEMPNESALLVVDPDGKVLIGPSDPGDGAAPVLSPTTSACDQDGSR